VDEVLISLIAATVSLAAGGAFKELFEKITPLLRRQQQKDVKSYAERLSELTQNLTSASRQVDSVLIELAQVATDRQSAAAKLEADLKALEIRETQLQQKIQHLEKLPLPVAEYFAEISKKEQKRSAWRDYLLFGAGVVLSTAIAIGLKFAGLG
jgi:DNA repair exonuclease SbcCD ATPase subunit